LISCSFLAHTQAVFTAIFLVSRDQLAALWFTSSTCSETKRELLW